MNIVYVFDENYIDLYKISSRSLLKHNPEAKITVVSPRPLPKDRVKLLEAKIYDEMNKCMAEVIEIRGKKYKICPKCGWKRAFVETEYRFCGSQL